MNRREFVKRLVMVAGGSILAIVGVPLLILPGSGMLLIVIGVGLVGEGIGFDVRGLLKTALSKAAGKVGTTARDGKQQVKATDEPCGIHCASNGQDGSDSSSEGNSL